MGRSFYASTGAAARRCPASAGFTLVELLVVIGIIALLIGVLLPSLNKARQQASMLACKANLRTIGQGIQLYANVSKIGTLPFGAYDGTATEPGSDWTILVNSMLMKNAGANWKDEAELNTLASRSRQAFQCPDAPSDRNNGKFHATDYACHPRLMPHLSDIDLLTNKPVKPYRQSHIKRSAEVAMIFDASLKQVGEANGGGWSVGGYDIPVAYHLDAYRWYYESFLTDALYAQINQPYMQPNLPIDLSTTNPADFNRDTDGNEKNIRFRHVGDKRCNILFADGHVVDLALKSQFQSEVTRSMINVNP